jgi:hypothetical protein
LGYEPHSFAEGIAILEQQLINPWLSSSYK